jgi:hypothetical protein
MEGVRIDTERPQKKTFLVISGCFRNCNVFDVGVKNYQK